jgi:hypothetical protein
MIDFLVDDAAHDDVVEAALWYELQQPGLGPQFITAAEHAFVVVRDHPPFVTAPLSRSRGRVVRRVFVGRFPYRVIFVDGAAFRRVISVQRHGRADRHWKRRL